MDARLTLKVRIDRAALKQQMRRVGEAAREQIVKSLNAEEAQGMFVAAIQGAIYGAPEGEWYTRTEALLESVEFSENKTGFAIFVNAEEMIARNVHVSGDERTKDYSKVTAIDGEDNPAVSKEGYLPIAFESILGAVLEMLQANGRYHIKVKR
jgi:hypothetical protein